MTVEERAKDVSESVQTARDVGAIALLLAGIFVVLCDIRDLLKKGKR